MSGVSSTTTRNQKLEAPHVDGEWSGRTDEEAHSLTVGLANLSVCEPNERLLLKELCGASSSPIITTMSYYGEVWLDGTDGLLGINTRLQPQELVPPTTIISVKPRFALANRLRDPLQYFPASAGLWSEGEVFTSSRHLRPTSDPLPPSKPTHIISSPQEKLQPVAHHLQTLTVTLSISLFLTCA